MKFFFAQEKESIIQKWIPEELIADVPENHPVLINKRIVTTSSGKQIIINGRNCLNLATHNYLGLLNSPDIKESAIAAVRKYGVGSCGPRGFYGTIGEEQRELDLCCLKMTMRWNCFVTFFSLRHTLDSVFFFQNFISDVHLELEERLAKFMQMEESVVYSYGFSTIASAIAAYCKRGDLVFTWVTIFNMKNYKIFSI